MAFESDADNLGGDPEHTNVFIHDLKTRKLILVSKSNSGANPDDFAEVVRGTRPINADGSFVVFSSPASNLGGGSMIQHVYRRGPLP